MLSHIYNDSLWQAFGITLTPEVPVSSADFKRFDVVGQGFLTSPSANFVIE
jgi:hypothetical protein